MKLERIASFVETNVEETLSYMDFPYERWSRLRTNNGLERIMKEIRRRARVVGNFEILVSISRFLKLSRIYC